MHRVPKRCVESKSNEASTCAFLTAAEYADEHPRKILDLRKRRAPCQFENEKMFHLTRVPTAFPDNRAAILAGFATARRARGTVASPAAPGFSRRSAGLGSLRC